MMAGVPQWTPDIEMNERIAASLVASAFPQFSGASVEAFSFGWDNTAFLVGGRALFRFPRRKAMAQLLEREIAFLPAVAPHLPLSISAPTYTGVATDAFPYAFAGYELMPGATACSRDLSNEERSAMAAPLGAFLRALHAIDAAPLLTRGLPSDEIGRLDHEKRSKASRARVDLIAGSGLVADIASFVTWLEAHPSVPITDEKRTFVHGDLYARHLIVDDRARITGVIDWGDLHHGDPAIDISIAHMVLPPSAHETFRDAYGAIDDRTWHVARYRAIYHAILEIEYGIRENDDGMKRSGVAALDLLRKSP